MQLSQAGTCTCTITIAMSPILFSATEFKSRRAFQVGPAFLITDPGGAVVTALHVLLILSVLRS